MEKVKVMYDLARLAFETDSTRAITLMLDGVSTPVLEIEDAKINDGYHNLSHHGKSEEKRSQLKTIDEWHMKLLGGSDQRLESRCARERKRCSTAPWCSTARTSATPTRTPASTCRRSSPAAASSTASTSRSTRARNYPLPNLFVSMLQRMGIETDRFASSTGTMRGLEMA